jgi:predicted nucleic acid-binding protein
MDELAFDTDILIDHLRGVSAATDLVKRVEEGMIIGYILTLTEAELFASKDSEDVGKRATLTELLSLFNKVDVDEMIARIAVEFRRKYGVELADAIIAATAFTTRCKLITRNIKDFEKVCEITTEKPY